MWVILLRWPVKLLRFVFREEGSGFFEVERVSVYGELIDTGVFGDRDDVLNTVASAAEGFDKKIDIYHADQFTGF